MSILYPIPNDEEQRLKSVLSYQILDTEEVEELNGLTKLAANIFNAPMALVTILDNSRQWFKSRYGLDPCETPRTVSFCQYTILGHDIFQVADATLDKRFKENPLVTGSPHIKFYCGAPLVNKEGYRMGSLAILDSQTRIFTDAQKETLKLLASFVVNQFELHKSRLDLAKEKDYLENAVKERTAELENKLVQLKKRDKELFVANHDFSRFVYKASHDLRGPLKTMIGITDLALSEVREDNIKLFLNLLLTTENKLDSILGNLLKIVEIKDATPENNDVDLTAAFYNALGKAKEKSGVSDVDFRLNNTYLKPVRSDQRMIEIILEEIFSNSLIYNDTRKVKIEVNLVDEQNNVLLEITDNGIGIADTEKDKLFNMFYKSKSTGSGLGLYLVKNVLDRLEGEIQYYSMDIGSKFNIKLPIERSNAV